jgi:alpha/beta superfamily hydrolase
LTTAPFDFRSAAGHKLAGRLEIPRHPVRGWAVFAHCFTCGKNGVPAVRVARSLAEAGIGVLRFDFAGLGQSDCRFGEESFPGDRAY